MGNTNRPKINGGKHWSLITFKAPDDLVERIEKRAVLRGKSKSWVIRRALEVYLSSNMEELLEYETRRVRVYGYKPGCR